MAPSSSVLWPSESRQPEEVERTLPFESCGQERMLITSTVISLTETRAQQGKRKERRIGAGETAQWLKVVPST